MKQIIPFIYGATVALVSAAGVYAVETKTAEATPPAGTTDSIGPKMVLEDWDWIERDLSIQVAKELDTRLPRFNKGDPVEWATLGGVIEKGVYEWASSNYVIIVRSSAGSIKTKKDVKIPFEKLGYTERMRCDFSFREEWVNLQSRIQTRTTLIENGVRLPGMPDPKARVRTPRLTAKPDPLENFEELFDAADPRAHTEMAMRFMQGEGVVADPAYAVMYFREAADQGDAHAMFNLGVMYFKGIGITRNPNTALGLFTASSERNHPSAKSTLSQLKVSAAKQRAAQEEYARAAAAYAKKGSEIANRYSQMLLTQPTRREDRSDKRFDGSAVRKTEVNRNKTRYSNKRR